MISGESIALPPTPPVDEMLRILPVRRRIMQRRATAWVRKNSALMFTSITRFHSSAECSSAGEAIATPALLTRMSMSPSASTT